MAVLEEIKEANSVNETVVNLASHANITPTSRTIPLIPKVKAKEESNALPTLPTLDEKKSEAVVGALASALEHPGGFKNNEVLNTQDMKVTAAPVIADVENLSIYRRALLRHKQSIQTAAKKSIQKSHQGDEVNPSIVEPTIIHVLKTPDLGKPCTTFHPFPKLPSELRIKIWVLSFRARRLSIESHRESDAALETYLNRPHITSLFSYLEDRARKYAHRRPNTPALPQVYLTRRVRAREIPAALLTCWESRNEALKSYEFLFSAPEKWKKDARSVERGIGFYVNPDIDTVQICTASSLGRVMEFDELSTLASTCASSVARIKRYGISMRSILEKLHDKREFRRNGSGKNGDLVATFKSLLVLSSLSHLDIDMGNRDILLAPSRYKVLEEDIPLSFIWDKLGMGHDEVWKRRRRQLGARTVGDLMKAIWEVFCKGRGPENGVGVRFVFERVGRRSAEDYCWSWE